MKKILAILLLSLTIAIVPSQKSHATIGALSSMLGAPVTGGVFAFAGLAAITGGAALSLTGGGDCRGKICLAPLYLGLAAGLVLLDDNTQQIRFEELSTQQIEQLEISSRQAHIYNSELEEINMIFNEVAAQLGQESTLDESKSLWQEYREFLSIESLDVLKRITHSR